MDIITTLAKNPLFLAIVLAGLIAVAGWIYWRVGSTHSMMDRVWHLIFGKMAIKDEKLATFIEASRDVDKFRFVYGLRIGRKEDIHRFLAWIDERQLDIQTIQQIRRWFDPKAKAFISPPPKRFRRWHVGFSVITIAFLTGCFAVTATSFALLQTKGSKIWFLSDGRVIKSLADNWSVELSGCEKSEVVEFLKQKQFTPTESSAVCNGIKDGSLERLIQGGIKQQRILAGLLEIIFAAAFVFFVREIAIATEAKRFLRDMA